MAERRSYKTTLFDREGPDAGIRIKAYSYAAIAGGASIPMFVGLGVLWGLPPAKFIALILIGPPFLTIIVGKLSLRALDGVEDAGHAVLAGTNSTPYTEQYSYQQALVMQGRLDDALASYEAIIAEENSTVDVRIRAAEMYTREAKRHDRAAELLREAIRHPSCTPSEEVYSANRLADLLSGPLGQPGRALVELRRLADRYKGSAVGDRAREAIRVMKNGGPVDHYRAAEAE
jgi:tetratricopeptide (TPR) repeat protein